MTDPEPPEVQLYKLRRDGWSVAVHNDYMQQGVKHTFWLFTHPDGRWIKGEAQTDHEALKSCMAAAVLKPAPPDTTHLSPQHQRTLDAALRRAVRIVDGWRTMETAPRDADILMAAKPADALIWKYGVGCLGVTGILWDWPWAFQPTHWQPIHPPTASQEAELPPAADDEAMVRELAAIVRRAFIDRPRNQDESQAEWIARAALARMRESRGGG